jgi:phage shock protein A
MVKGGVLGLALAGAGLFWIFGGKALDLVQSKAEKARAAARAAMTSFDDEIELARKQVSKLRPAIGQGAEALAKLEDGVAQVKAEVATLEVKLAERSKRIEALTAMFDGGSVQRVGTNGKSSKARVEADLAREIDGYKQLEKTLGYTQDTLKYRQALVQTAHDELMQMKAKEKVLLSKIDEIEARHKARVASQQFNEYRIDTSPVAEAEKTVSQLDRQENISARTDQLQGELSEEGATAVEVGPAADRDVRREAMEILNGGAAPEATATADRGA